MGLLVGTVVKMPNDSSIHLFDSLPLIKSWDKVTEMNLFSLEIIESEKATCHISNEEFLYTKVNFFSRKKALSPLI